jgi:hypothetical protein
MILSAFSLLMFDHSVFAKSNTSDAKMSQYIVAMIDDTREKARVEELSNAVQLFIQKEIKNGWTPKEIFLVKSHTEYIEMTLINEAAAKIVKLNKEGIVIG